MGSQRVGHDWATFTFPFPDMFPAPVRLSTHSLKLTWECMSCFKLLPPYARLTIKLSQQPLSGAGSSQECSWISVYAIPPGKSRHNKQIHWLYGTVCLGFFFVSGCLLSSVGTFHSLHLPTHAHFHMEGEISGHSPPATALPRNLSRSPKGPRCCWRWQPKCRWNSTGRGRQKIPGCHSEQCQFKLLPWTSLQGRRAPVSPASPANPHWFNRWLQGGRRGGETHHRRTGSHGSPSLKEAQRDSTDTLKTRISQNFVLNLLLHMDAWDWWLPSSWLLWLWR